MPRTDGVASMLAPAVPGGQRGSGRPSLLGSEELAPELVQRRRFRSSGPSLWLVPGEGRPSPSVRRAAQVLERTLGAALRRWERGLTPAPAPPFRYGCSSMELPFKASNTGVFSTPLGPSPFVAGPP